MAEIHTGAGLHPSKLDLLTAWMGRQRWYAAKGSTPALTRLAGWRLGDPAGEVGVETLIVLDTAGPEPVTYQVPLTYRGAPVDGLDHALVGTLEHGVLGTRWVYDGPHDPVYAAQLLALCCGRVGAESSTTSDAADDRFVGEPAATWQDEVSVTGSRVLSGEQSNTSIIYDAVTPDGGARPLIAKVFRMLADGENPDVVLQSALRAAGSTRVPEVVGAVRGQWPTGLDAAGEPVATASGHLAFAQEFLPGSPDAWRVTLADYRSGSSVAERAHALGAATAEVHRLLAAALGRTPTTAADIAATVAGMQARFAAAVEVVPDLAELREAVTAVFEHAQAADWPEQQRIHGDYHLGQVLFSPARGWVLLDFEGEPLRSLAERNRPDQWLRDIAGMLRSYDYAGGTLEVEDGVDARALVEAAQRAFLDGYSADAASGGGGDPRRHAALLAAYQLDKAMYEVVYEARNRPTWLPIPLGAVRRLVGG